MLLQCLAITHHFLYENKLFLFVTILSAAKNNFLTGTEEIGVAKYF